MICYRIAICKGKQPNALATESIRSRHSYLQMSDSTIELNARKASLTVSSYLRNAALNHPISSTADRQAFLALLKVNADLGRLGGLLKLWLVTRPGQGAKVIDVRRLLHDIEETQHRMKTAIDVAVRSLR